ncbi:ARID DNA-binding domain-containing protein [Tanacetum coccineum]|uniref:ARID DNA-binding domain-containing protein n=1 Tax=Tanacetum coccineum TaxID=301880 RepID=A0ABQ5DV20_9ASTR
MMIKRDKIASKSLHNLLFHHHHNWVVATLPRHLPPPPSDDENEFSCTATPQNQNKLHYHLDANDVIVNALEILKNATASPAMSRFGKSPMVKELRLTDSPFALNNGEEDGDQVDEAAEKFIMRFYNSLRGQN